MRLQSILLVATLASVIAPSAADATSCRDWNRMNEAMRYDRIDRMINDAVTGQKGRSYHVNRNAIGRCLESRSRDMYWDFSDMCDDPDRAAMNAIHTRFKNYLWTCVN